MLEGGRVSHFFALGTPAKASVNNHQGTTAPACTMNMSIKDPHELHLRRGQHARLRAPTEGTLVVEQPGGQGSLTIEWQEGRAKVQLQKADLEILCSEAVSFHCDTFRVQADREIELNSEGSWSAKAVDGMDLRGRSMALRATLGDLALTANDFVRAIGEKILLNTDTDPEQSRRQAKQLLSRLLGHRIDDAAVPNPRSTPE